MRKHSEDNVLREHGWVAAWGFGVFFWGIGGGSERHAGGVEWAQGGGESGIGRQWRGDRAGVERTVLKTGLGF
jgi:hypothetical protein